jgi:Pilus assembly protein, PilP
MRQKPLFRNRSINLLLKRGVSDNTSRKLWQHSRLLWVLSLAACLIMYYRWRSHSSNQSLTPQAIPQESSHSPVTSHRLGEIKLPQFAVNTFQFAGFLKKTPCEKNWDNCSIGLIKTPDGQILSIKRGDLLGKEQAQVTQISSNSIQLTVFATAGNTPHQTIWIRPA